MMEGAKKEMAQAFVNFLSMPKNVIRNMYYIGYTSCMAGKDKPNNPNELTNPIYDYVSFTYSADEGDSDVAEYDLSYFFGPGKTLSVPTEQTRRQLFAQYPDKETIQRLVVMNYFDKETNERANRMWNNIK
jgi:spermidine/putrescine transport system substrate-binding protein